MIDRQVGHLRRLVDDLLDVSRITRGEVELKKQALDLKVILTRAIEDVHALLEERRHKLSVDFVAASTWVLGDATRLTQVFTNLLTNAAKYTDPGGVISVSTSVRKGQIVVSVRDNGTGISPRLFPRLFNIFEQGASTIDRSKGGLGIGLALVKNFVERHDGTVTADSAGVGLGSEFTVVLPLLREIVDDLLEPGREPARGAQTTRVLVVDDNIDALQTMQSCLSALGYEVATANGPVEALAKAAVFRPTVALLDIGLPVMDGYELGGKLREQFGESELRLFALSGYGQAKDRERSKSAGFDGHFVKPVDLDDLTRVLALDHVGDVV